MFELSPNCFYFAHEISTSLLTLLSNSLQEIFDDKLFQARANLWFILGLSTKLFLKFWKGCQNCFFRCWMKTSCNENFPWEKILSLIFFFKIWIIYFQERLWKNPWKIGESFFNVSRGLCWSILLQKVLELQFLSDIQRPFSWLFNKMWLSKLQFTCPDEKPIDFFFFEKHSSIHVSELQSESHRNFGKIFWAWLSKLQTNCSEDTSDDNVFQIGIVL